MSKVNLYFNTALSAIGDDGKFDEEAFRALIMPIRAELMKIDGLTGCSIARYGVEVSYEEDIVSKTKVIRLVREVFAGFAERATYFPLRGNKVPRLVIPRPRRVVTTTPWVYIDFKTSIVRYLAGTDEGSFDDAVFRATTAQVVQAMTNLDGVLGWRLKLHIAGIKVNTDVTSVEAIQAHLIAVFEAAAQTDDKIFPYLEQGAPLPHSFRIVHA